jgi:predicted  nucleic acid-binding Zn-ribbon protein
MSTNKHRVLPVSEDLDDTVELPSLPAVVDSPSATWVAPQLAAGAVTEEFMRPSIAEMEAVARAERAAVERAAAERATAERTAAQAAVQAATHAAEHAAAQARLNELTRELATRVEQHRLGEAERDELRLRLERVQAELNNADKVRDRQALLHGTQQRDWEQERSQRDVALVRAQGDLAEMRRRAAAHSEALQHLEGRRYVFDAMFRERETLLDERDARLDALASELGAARAQLQNASTETAFARDEAAAALGQASAQRTRADELQATLATMQSDIATVHEQRETALRDIAGLKHDAADHGEALRVLQEQLRTAQLTIESLRGDLAAAEDLIRTHESEQQQRAARISRLEGSEAALRARLESAERLAAERAARREHVAAEPLAVTGDFDAPGARPTPPPLDGQLRLLVRTEGDTGIVHLLRRTTTIGRTPDNDLCIDEEFISRHHAVVLVAASGTVLEDLNSTNGVFVNGARITRRQLSEGDLVTIGKTGFRYILKPPAEFPTS